MINLIWFSLVLPWPVHAQNKAPHVPTEQELNERLHGKKDDHERDYQRDSVENFGTNSQGVIAWLKARLAAVNITPARFLLGLGILGQLFTWNKNKKKSSWFLVYLFSIVLILVGLAAIIFRWPAWN